MYENIEGQSVKLEAVGKIDKDYVQTLDFIWRAMKRAAQEVPSDYSGPFSPLTLPTQNDLLKLPKAYMYKPFDLTLIRADNPADL